MVLGQRYLKPLVINGNVMKTKDRQEKRGHASRIGKDLIFAPPHFLKGTEMPTLNFSSRFLPTLLLAHLQVVHFCL